MRRGRREVLGRQFIASAKRHWGSFCMADSAPAPLTFGRALVGGAAAVALDPPRTPRPGRASACCCRRRSAARSPTSRLRSPGKTSGQPELHRRAAKRWRPRSSAAASRRSSRRGKFLAKAEIDAARRHGVPRRRARRSSAPLAKAADARHRVPAAGVAARRGSTRTKATPSRSPRSSSRAAAPACRRA